MTLPPAPLIADRQQAALLLDARLLKLQKLQKLLELLLHDWQSVRELREVLDYPAQHLYYQLRKLQVAGLVDMRWSSGPNRRRQRAFKLRRPWFVPLVMLQEILQAAKWSCSRYA